MADHDDLTGARKKISIDDLSSLKANTAPELSGAADEPADGTSDPTDAPEQGSADEHDKPEPAEAGPETKEDNLDDEKTDKAVEDILKKDGDEVLRAQDEAAEADKPTKRSFWGKIGNCFKAWWTNRKARYGTIAGLVVVIGALFAVPITRYNILGVAMSASVTVEAVDSKSGDPVSGATVTVAGKTVETNADGVAVARVHLGSRTAVASKKYYTGSSKGVLVGMGSNHIKLSLVALGRQVDVKVVNKLTGKPVANAEITAGGAKTKTDAKGLAKLVIPSGAQTQPAQVGGSGYNTLTVSIIAADDLTKNTYSVVPAGKLYFLSNLSGSIDVVKTDLDGGNRKVVLAGTGKEDADSTSLLASRDWKYLALLSKRSGDKASVYLIDTTDNDLMTTVDEGDASFSLVGWSGDRFIYQVTRNSVANWQSNQQVLKSFDPTNGQTLLLDQTQAEGTNSQDYIKQQFGSVYLVGDQVVYAKNWITSYTSGSAVSGDKQASLDTIGADGSGHKTVKTFALESGTSAYYLGINTKLSAPKELYVSFSAGAETTYYEYQDGKVTEATDMTDTKFYNSVYNTYLLSPNGSQTLWSEQRDGKNGLFLGTASGGSGKQVATLSDYNIYGWFTDDYLLVSKSSSELYIMPASGGTPFKVTDYYKPAINYAGYGGGYGGL